MKFTYGIIGVTCPNCNHEFRDDLDAIKYRLEEVKATIKDIDFQFAILSASSEEEQESKKQWKVDALLKKRYLMKEQLELKARFDKWHQRRQDIKNKLLRGIIRDFYGDREFDRCMDELDKRIAEECKEE